MGSRSCQHSLIQMVDTVKLIQLDKRDIPDQFYNHIVRKPKYDRRHLKPSSYFVNLGETT